VDIWDLYAQYDDAAKRSRLTPEQRQLLAICDLRQEVNAGGFDSYLRYWGADTAGDALTLLPRALGDEWHRVLTEALSIFGTASPTNADQRAEVIDGAAEADDVLGLADERFYELEAEQSADERLGALADELSPCPTQTSAPQKRRLFGRRKD
jgi:hypothetical protein